MKYIEPKLFFPFNDSEYIFVCRHLDLFDIKFLHINNIKQSILNKLYWQAYKKHF